MYSLTITHCLRYLKTVVVLLLLLSLSLPALAQRGRGGLPANRSAINGVTHNSNRRPPNQHALPVQACMQPMPQRAFMRELQIIDGIRQPITRGVQVERVITDHCVTSHQVGQLLHRIPTAHARLQAAQLGWHYVFDPPNYHLVFNALGSGHEAQQLELYMANHPHGVPQGRGRGGRGIRPQPVPHPHPQQGQAFVPGYTGPVGCPGPIMPQGQFNNALQNISSRSFSDEQQLVATQMLRHNCLTTNQVRRLLEVFRFENDQVEMAKVAFQSTYDIGNYYLLSDVFRFSSSTRELNTFLDAQPELRGPNGW